MLKQSEKYFDAMYTTSVVRSNISGKIQTLTGEIYKLEDADIIPGSLTKNNKCVNGSSFEIGAVYQGELNVTLKSSFDRYTLMGGSISFTEHRYLQDGAIEDVNIGKFYIASADRSKKLTTIKAVDSMGNMDIDIVTDMVGTAYDLLAVLAEKCGVYLAQTEEEIAALPNGLQIYSVSADTTETYRDLLAYLGMMTGTFATINVNDKLELRAYAVRNCMEMPVSKRAKDSTILADYVTYYKGLQARFIAQENYAPYKYVDDTIADGLILDLGDIPIVRGLPETKNVMLQTVFEVIRQIRYVPAELTIVTSDAALELGDRIGIAGEDVDTYITSYNWTYHGSEKIKGVGDNPRLKASGDRQSKRMAELEEKINTKDVIVHTYTNASAYTIKAAEKEIISINYAAMTNTRTIFIATIPFDVDLDGYIVFSYYLDEVAMAYDTIKQYVSRGRHFATISNNLTVEKDTRHTLSVKAHMEFFESDTRQQAAKILSFERYITTNKYTEQPIDATPPVASIAANSIRAALYAQGLAGTEVWDGTINIAEYITPMELPMLQMAGFTANSILRDPTGPGKGITESFAAFDLPMLPLVGVVALPTLNRTVDNYIFDAEHCRDYSYNEAYVDADGAYRLNTVYEFAAIRQDLEEGQLYIVTIETSQFASVWSIELSAPGDGDRKYLIYAGDIYYCVTDGELTETAITELTAEEFAVYGSPGAPDGSLLLGLTDPQVLCWTDGEEQLAMTADITAMPMPQTIVSGAIDLTHETIKGIENITADCEGPLILAVSFDNRETWKAWNGSEWITLSEETSGMSRETLEAVTADQWQLYQGADNLYIRVALINKEQSLSEIRINFVNQEVERK